MSRQLLLWRARFPGTKQAGRTDPAGIEIPGFDMATTSITSVHALKKHRLQIKPGSGLYTAINNFSFQKKSGKWSKILYFWVFFREMILRKTPFLPTDPTYFFPTCTDKALWKKCHLIGTNRLVWTYTLDLCRIFHPREILYRQTKNHLDCIIKQSTYDIAYASIKGLP